LQIAPSGYRRYAAQQRNPQLQCARTKRDAALMPEIQRVWEANMKVYGADHVNRQFKADRPNQLWVSDFTYVSTWQGWLYVAFVIDVFARRIVGWRVSSSMQTDFVLDALEQALYDRQPERGEGLIHHSDRGSQYVSIRYTERLAEAGIESSVGSRGDSYDNALAETINGLYKAEVIHRRGPWKTKAAVELATLEWVAWFNHHRLLAPIGYIPPAEAEANYYRQRVQQAMMQT
jgi:putative transposase